MCKRRWLNRKLTLLRFPQFFQDLKLLLLHILRLFWLHLEIGEIVAVRNIEIVVGCCWLAVVCRWYIIALSLHLSETLWSFVGMRANLVKTLLPHYLSQWRPVCAHILQGECSTQFAYVFGKCVVMLGRQDWGRRERERERKMGCWKYVPSPASRKKGL